MAQKYYLTNKTAPYTPATLRGAWDQTNNYATRALEPLKDFGGSTARIATDETNSSPTWDVLLYRGVSGTLAAQTITGTVDIVAGVWEQIGTIVDLNWHIHIYVTQGDSDTPRGTLLSDYVEAAGVNEWPTVETGASLSSPAALSALAISDGDRIVVEIGYIARNTLTAQVYGSFVYGTLDSNSFPRPDLTVGQTSPLSFAGFLNFSNDIVESIAERFSQAYAENITPQAIASSVRFTSVSAENITPQAISSAIRVSNIVVEVMSRNVASGGSFCWIGEGMGGTFID